MKRRNFIALTAAQSLMLSHGFSLAMKSASKPDDINVGCSYTTKRNTMTNWHCALELNAARKTVAGSEKKLTEAIRRGADLRILTEFAHGEHIDPTSDSTEIIREVSEFAVTCLLKNSWVAGMMSLRQPISLPTGFGGVSSMSFFMYNQNGQQAIARPYLDGVPRTGMMGTAPFEQPPNMPKYHIIDKWDENTNAPSSNFIYDFDLFRYLVNDSWQEALSHDASGNVISGSLKDLTDAFSDGCDVKIGISGLCNDLTDSPSEAMDNELFVKTGWTYYYTDQNLFMVGSYPIIRCKPGIPLQYESRGWDFGWLMIRSDGHVVYRRCDPYTLKFSDIEYRLPVRWFVR